MSIDWISHTYEVEATRCQALREMWSKQKTCEESQADVLVVQGSCFIVCTALPYTQENLGTDNVPQQLQLVRFIYQIYKLT